MLGSAQRLRRSNEFAAAVRSGRRAGRGALVVHLQLPGSATHPSPDTSADLRPSAGRVDEHVPSARAGFVVSKAIGSAVTRNRVRRRLRHLVRERLAALPPGSVLVVRALPAAATSSYARLGADLDAAIAAATAPRPARSTRHDAGRNVGRRQ